MRNNRRLRKADFREARLMSDPAVMLMSAIGLQVTDAGVCLCQLFTQTLLLNRHFLYVIVIYNYKQRNVSCSTLQPPVALTSLSGSKSINAQTTANPLYGLPICHDLRPSTTQQPLLWQSLQLKSSSSQLITTR